jgi:hypothetical protein
MAKMTPIIPAIRTSLPNGWELVATEAGRYVSGLTASIALMNGTMQACESLPLADGDYRQAFSQMISYRTNIPAVRIEAKLLELLTAIEGSFREQTSTTEATRESQGTRLVALALDAGAELFHTPDGEAYATIAVDGHKETWPLKVKGFRRWLARLFYQAEDKSPGAQAVQDALGVLEGKALFDGPESPVFTRLSEQNDAIYLDLANTSWQTVEISVRGWRIVETSPVKFRRSKGMLSLPAPEQGGDLSVLHPFLNIATAEDWCLIVSWLLATLRPTGPYPVLVVHGEQGSAKSTLVRVLRSLVDPNTAALRTTPRDERDLVIAAANGWLIALDNLSHLQDWLSDALCRLATGSGFATRELYSDAEETIFAAQRPIVMNGIEELATRADLLDRAIVLSLPTIPEDTRQDENAFWQAFEQARPHILGALLDIVSVALGTLHTVSLAKKPRMADFAKWACAAAPACGWTAAHFLEAYAGVRAASHELIIEASSVAQLVRDLMEKQTQWTGTASELLAQLALLAGEQVTKQQAWPKNGQVLSNGLRRLAPTLRAIGIHVTIGGRSGKKGSRLLHLTQSPPQVVTGTMPAGTPQGTGRVQGTI